MGLGMPFPLANVIGIFSRVVSAVGASIGSATKIGPQDYLNMVLSGTSGLVLPPVSGGELGCYNGDQFRIFNATAAAIVIYANNNAQGSATTIYMNAASVAGTTGVSVGTGQMCLLYPFTTSTWVGFRSSV